MAWRFRPISSNKRESGQIDTWTCYRYLSIWKSERSPKTLLEWSAENICRIVFLISVGENIRHQPNGVHPKCFTEFAEFSDNCHYSKRARTCHTVTSSRDRIFKSSPIHAPVIFRFSEFAEFTESSAIFRKNPIRSNDLPSSNPA